MLVQPPEPSKATPVKLIIVQRAKVTTFNRLSQQFAGADNVRVILERRRSGNPDGPAAERRRLQKSFNGRDYIVVHTADRRSIPLSIQ